MGLGSRKNLKNYLAGKEPLEWAILPFDDDDKIVNFVKKSMRRSLWVIPFDKWQKYQSKVKKNEVGD